MPDLNRRKSDTIEKVAGYVAGVLIVAAILSTYAYTRDVQTEMRAAVMRVETSARKDRERLERSSREDLVRVSDRLSRQIENVSEKLDRLIELRTGELKGKTSG